MSFRSFFTDTIPTWWSPSGLIQVVPGSTWHFKWIYVGLLAACLLLAIVTLFLKIRPSLKARIQAFAWTNLLLGILLYFCRIEQIPYLGMDGLRFLQEIGIVLWINSIILFSRKGMQKEVLSEQVQARREKYLPGKSA